MKHNNLLVFDGTLSSKEQSRVSHVLENYLINPISIEKVDNVYKINCDEGCYCLYKVSKIQKKDLKCANIAEHLKNNKFNSTAGYIKTKNNKFYINGKKNSYYIKEWLEGRECDIRNIEELKEGAKVLGEFHIKARGFYVKGCGLRSRGKNWQLKFISIKQNLLYFKRIIERKKVKTPFDSYYYNLIDDFVNQINKSLEVLEKSHYAEVSSRSFENKCICHNRFKYKDIKIDKSGRLYLANLDRCAYGMYALDIAGYIGDILRSSTYSWSFETAKDIIDAYNLINPLSKEEVGIILAFVIFPYKFWKLGKKRYAKNKKWSEDKFIRKLNRITRHEEQKKEFVNRFIEYYNLEI